MDHRADLFGLLLQLVQHLPHLDARRLEIVFEHEVVQVGRLAQALLGLAGHIEVTQAQAAAGHLVLVGGPDAAAGGADLRVAAFLFAGLVQGDVPGQDERAGIADAQAAAYIHAGRLQLGDFGQQGLRREHHAVADVAGDIGAQDAGGNQAQHLLAPFDDQGMAGIVSPLEADDALDLIGEQVHDLALALVTPLGADHHQIPAHESFPVSRH